MTTNRSRVWAVLFLMASVFFFANSGYSDFSIQAAKLRKIKWFVSVNNLGCIPGNKLVVYVNNKLSCTVTQSAKRTLCGKYAVGKTYWVTMIDGNGAVYTKALKTKIPNKKWIKVHYEDVYCF